MSKIGILGGTFDPIHKGHISLAIAAYEQYGLDKVLVMVSNNPPHKKDKTISDINHRVNMVKLAIEPYSYMEYSDFELKREGYIYTADTLTLLKEANPDDEYYFIIGGDSLESLNKWYHPEIVLSKAIILASLREGVDEIDYISIVNSLIKEYSSYGVCPDIRKLKIEAIDISSSNIRLNIWNDDNIKNYLSNNVYNYIKDNQLYKDTDISLKSKEKATKKYFAELRNELKKILSKSRYEHSIGVELTSAALAMRYEYNIFDARTAGLLHDCAKYMNDDDMLKECHKNNIPVTEIENRKKHLLHPKLGAYYAKHIYNIDNQDILNAICYHTTGRPDMSLIEKIVFVADYIEPARDRAKNLTEIRKMSFVDIDKAVLMILRDTLNYLKELGEEIDETTQLTYNYYVNILSKED